MADTFEADHITAVMALLYADTGLTTYPDSGGFTPTTPAAQYVRVYSYVSRSPLAVGNTLDGRANSATVWLYAHCVGPNEISAVAIAGRVRAAWLDVRPVVAGRECGLIRQEQAMPPVKDDSTGTTVLDAVCVYRFTSN